MRVILSYQFNQLVMLADAHKNPIVEIISHQRFAKPVVQKVNNGLLLSNDIAALIVGLYQSED
jgi:hypothetical protein